MNYRKYKYTAIGSFSIEIGTGFNAIGVGFKIGGGDGDEITLRLHLIAGIYLSYSAKWVWKFTGFISKIFKQKYRHTYASHIHFTRHAFSLELFGDHVGEDALFHYYVNLDRLIKGNSKVTYQTLQEGSAEVVMPEKRYQATYKIQNLIFKYPRWFTKVRTDINIKVEEGIPHEGKGENSWDCGMDYTYSMSTSYKGSLRGALDAMALSVIKSRQRHSSLDKYLNVPSGMPTKSHMEQAEVANSVT